MSRCCDCGEPMSDADARVYETCYKCWTKCRRRHKVRTMYSRQYRKKEPALAEKLSEDVPEGYSEVADLAWDQSE